MLGSECDLKMHVQNLGYVLPLKIGAPNPSFLRRLRDLIATLTAYIFGLKQDIDNWAKALETKRGLLHFLKIS